jgi:Zn-dependent peptidase ImmA (M78 family)
VTEAIESAGGIVIELSDHDGFDGLSGWARGSIPVVGVNESLSADRRRFDRAHELGHLCREVDDSAQAIEERLAHRFAAAFLVPARPRARSWAR